ncbi:F-box family protein [Striga asiatica]|uniref:F-box family protein n=1 Tax=Striga asiatica TaxID=4170 RepID=A0A5A7RD21_STRAF|nr:F-box family protein [Striga asiatica]
MTVRASCNDLLLVSNYQGYYYICNPVTKKYFPIPIEYSLETKIGFALVCNLPDFNEPTYKVVVLDRISLVDASGEALVSRYGQTVRVFCSESGQWTKSFFLFPSRPTRDHAEFANVVSCNGILYWMDGLHNLDRVVSLDLADNRCGVIYFPDIVRNHDTRPPNDSRIQIGVVRDELRLLHVLRVGPGMECFVLRVWELDRWDGSWALVDERDLRFSDTVVAAIFHPKDCDSIFVVCGKSVYECGVSKDTCRELGEFGEMESIGDEGLASFVLVHPLWPTPIPGDV